MPGTNKVAECRGLAPLARRHALVSTEARLACPVDIPENRPRPGSSPRQRPHEFEDEDENDDDEDEVELVGVGRLALPRLFDFESNRSAVPD